MRVFSADLEEFQRKIVTNEIFRDLEANYAQVAGHSVGYSEAASWRGSLPRLEAAVRLAGLLKDVRACGASREILRKCIFRHHNTAFYLPRSPPPPRASVVAREKMLRVKHFGEDLRRLEQTRARAIEVEVAVGCEDAA